MFADRRLTGLLLAAATLAAALAPAGQARVDAQQNADFLRIKVEAAAAAYDQAKVFFLERRIEIDTAYLWSVRSLNARLEGSQTPEARLAAYQAHLDEMKDIERRIALVARIGTATRLETSSTHFYRAEAELWMARERSKKPDDRPQ